MNNRCVDLSWNRLKAFPSPIVNAGFTKSTEIKLFNLLFFREEILRPDANNVLPEFC